MLLFWSKWSRSRRARRAASGSGSGSFDYAWKARRGTTPPFILIKKDKGSHPPTSMVASQNADHLWKSRGGHCCPPGDEGDLTRRSRRAATPLSAGFRDSPSVGRRAGWGCLPQLVGELKIFFMSALSGKPESFFAAPREACRRVAAIPSSKILCPLR